MDVRKFFLGQDEFKMPSEIAARITEARAFNPHVEDAKSAEPLLIFQTSKQQTWLVATKARLYCVLDDLPRGFTRVQWSMNADTLVEDGKVIIPISTRDKTDRTGLLDIGMHRGWLFSKKLFTARSIEEELRTLLLQKMT
jgi:hypothetical protein